jgi:hypothetical protein
LVLKTYLQHHISVERRGHKLFATAILFDPSGDAIIARVDVK